MIPAAAASALVLSAAAAGLAARTTEPDLSGLGLPVTGAVTQFAVVACQALSTCSAVVTVGFLLIAAVMERQRHGGRLGPIAARAMRRASWTAAGWACITVLLVPLTVADALGNPVTQVMTWAVLSAAGPSLPASAGAACTLVLAGAVSVGCRYARLWGAAWLLLLGSALALVPIAVTGHSGTGRQHELATDSMVLHILAVSVWVGGLVAVLLHAIENPHVAEPAVRRFSGLALACWLVLGATGVINAAIRSSPRDILTTHYGALLLVKILILVGLGCIGAAQRARTLSAIRAGQRSGLLRLGAIELLLMATTLGVSAALSRTAPPRSPSQTATPYLGLHSVLSDWNPDLLLGGASVLAAVLYGRSVATLRRRAAHWSRSSTWSWMTGCATILVVTCSGIGTHAATVTGLHLTQHIVLSTVAPLLLMAGQPLRLILCARGDFEGSPRPAELPTPADAARYSLTAATTRTLTHPLIGFALVSVPTFVLHRSGYFDRTDVPHWQHLALSCFFLLAGMLFFWPVLSRDLAPRSSPPAIRRWLLVGIVAVHLVSGVRPRNGSLIPLSAASGHLVHAAVLSALLAGFWLFLRRSPDEHSRRPSHATSEDSPPQSGDPPTPGPRSSPTACVPYQLQDQRKGLKRGKASAGSRRSSRTPLAGAHHSEVS